MSEELLTLAEAAERLGLRGASGLRHAIRDGKLVAVQRGPLWFVSIEAIDAYAARRKPWHVARLEHRQRTPKEDE